MKIWKIWKIAQTNFLIDTSRYEKSIRERIEQLVTFSAEEYQRLQSYQFNPSSVINALQSAGYPNVNAVQQFIDTKDTNTLHDILMDIFAWFKSKKDHKLWDKIYPAVKALNDYESILMGNEIVWTEEFAQQKIKEFTEKTYQNMEKLQQNLSNAISRIPQWNGSPINIIANELYKDNDLDAETDASIEIGTQVDWAGAANFSYFAIDENKIVIDDVLEGGDEEFFTDNNIQSDYFNLINALRNPNAFSQPKVLTLYTSRPSKDRSLYTNAKTVPSNIFLTSKYDFAEGFSREYGGNRDVWRVRISDRYLVKTMDAPDQKQYQVVGDKEVPVISIELITPWESIR